MTSAATRGAQRVAPAAPAAILASAIGITLVTGCSRASDASNAGDASDASAGASAAVDAGVFTDAARPHAKGRVSACRAVSVSGPVNMSEDARTGEGIREGEPLPDRLFLGLGPQGTFTARDPRSLRETRFTGPGFVRPCVGNIERSDLLAGTFASTPGSGEAPGHEEWVVTGSAVVRYGAAAVEVRAASLNGVIDIRPRGGESFLWVSPRATLSGDPGSEHVDAGPGQRGWVALSTRSGEPYRVNLTKGVPPDEAFVDDCLALSTAAAKLADQLHDAGAAFGATAGAHVEALRQARAACDIADLRLTYALAGGGDAGPGNARASMVAIEAALERAKLGNPR